MKRHRSQRRWNYALCAVWSLCSNTFFQVEAYERQKWSQCSTTSSRSSVMSTTALRDAQQHDPDFRDDEEVFYVRSGPSPSLMTPTPSASSTKSTDQTRANYMDDLAPPAINLKRDSILFSDNPSTRRNNFAVSSWKTVSKRLPPVVTGVWPWRDPTITERNPEGALYNMIFVRIPVILLAIGYINNQIQGNPLVMDMGRGPTELSPVLVLLTLAIILA